MDSTDDSYADDNSNEKSINADNLEEIQDIKYVHPHINTRDARLKVFDRISQAQSEWRI